MARVAGGGREKLPDRFIVQNTIDEVTSMKALRYGEPDLLIFYELVSSSRTQS